MGKITGKGRGLEQQTRREMGQPSYPRPKSNLLTQYESLSSDNSKPGGSSTRERLHKDFYKPYGNSNERRFTARTFYGNSGQESLDKGTRSNEWSMTASDSYSDSKQYELDIDASSNDQNMTAPDFYGNSGRESSGKSVNSNEWSMTGSDSNGDSKQYDFDIGEGLDEQDMTAGGFYDNAEQESIGKSTRPSDQNITIVQEVYWRARDTSSGRDIYGSKGYFEYNNMNYTLQTKEALEEKLEKDYNNLRNTDKILEAINKELMDSSDKIDKLVVDNLSGKTTVKDLHELEKDIIRQEEKLSRIIISPITNEVRSVIGNMEDLQSKVLRQDRLRKEVSYSKEMVEGRAELLKERINELVGEIIEALPPAERERLKRNERNEIAVQGEALQMDMDTSEHSQDDSQNHNLDVIMKVFNESFKKLNVRPDE